MYAPSASAVSDPVGMCNSVTLHPIYALRPRWGQWAIKRDCVHLGMSGWSEFELHIVQPQIGEICHVVLHAIVGTQSGQCWPTQKERHVDCHDWNLDCKPLPIDPQPTHRCLLRRVKTRATELEDFVLVDDKVRNVVLLQGVDVVLDPTAPGQSATAGAVSDHVQGLPLRVEDNMCSVRSRHVLLLMARASRISMPVTLLTTGRATWSSLGLLESLLSWVCPHRSPRLESITILRLGILEGHESFMRLVVALLNLRLAEVIDWAVLWFVPLCLWFFGTVFWYFPSLMIRSFPHLRTSCLHLTRSQRKREKERRPQPPFGPSVDSAIRDSQQPTSPIGFLFLKLPPPPCAVLLFCLCFLGMFCWYFPSFMTRSFPNFGTSCFHLARSQDLSTTLQKISETQCMFSGKMCLNKNKLMFISINFETWIYKFLMFFIFLKLVNHSCQQTIWTKQIYEKTW